MKDYLLTRFAFNTAFIPEYKALVFPLKELDPDSTAKDKRFPPNFSIFAKFENFCECTVETPFSKKCSSCMIDLQTEVADWETIYTIMEKYRPHSGLEASCLLFGDPDLDDVEEVMKKHKGIISQLIQMKPMELVHTKNTSQTSFNTLK